MTPPTFVRCAVLALCVSVAARAEPAPPAATQPIAPLVRIGAETGGGIVGGALLGGTAAWIISATLDTQESGTSSNNSAAQVGAALGVSVGAPIGVSLTGKLLGRQGSFIISWLSSVAGLGVGYGIYGLVSAGSDSSAAKATYALCLLLPVAGAVIGYELTSHEQPASDPVSALPALLPAVSFGPGGGAFALVGRF